MSESQALVKTAEKMVDEILELKGDDALLAITIITTYILNWSAYKLFQEGEGDLSEEFSKFSRRLEIDITSRPSVKGSWSSEVLPFPPKSKM